MTTYRGPNYKKADLVGQMFESDCDLYGDMQFRFWQAFYGCGLKHIKTSYTADFNNSSVVETVTGDCGIDALEGKIKGIGGTSSAVWNMDSNWMLDDGLKPIYLRFLTGQYYFAQTSTNSSYWLKATSYWYIGEELDVNDTVAYGNTSTVYKVSSDYGTGLDGPYATDGNFWQSSLSDGTLHVSAAKSDLAPDTYPGRHFFMERSRDEAGNIDEKGVIAGFSGAQNGAYLGNQTTTGWTYTVAREFGKRTQTWDNDSTRRRCGLQHFPLTNDINGNVATYDNNVIPMSTMVARWGEKWWPSRAFVIVPKGYVHHQQEVLINVNGSPLTYASLCLNIGGAWSVNTGPHYNVNNGEQTLALWE